MLEAASRIVAEVGFSRATTARIARAAGCALETLYAQFFTKERHYAAVVERRCMTFRELPPKPDPGSDFEQTIHLVARELPTIVSDVETAYIVRLLTGDQGSIPGLTQLFFEGGPAKLFELLKQLLDARCAAGEIEVRNTRRRQSYSCLC